MIDAKLHVQIDAIKNLKRLKTGLQRKFMRIALNKALGVIKTAVVAEAPRRHGYLAKYQRVKVKLYPKGFVGMVGVKSGVKKKKGKYKTGKKKGEPIIHSPSRYAHLVRGGANGGRSNDYLVRGVSRARGRFVSIMNAKLKQLLATAIK